MIERCTNKKKMKKKKEFKFKNKNVKKIIIYIRPFN